MSVPIVIILAGGLAKKLSRGAGWSPRDFYVGTESCLAAISTGLVNLFETARVLKARTHMDALGGVASVPTWNVNPEAVGDKLATLGGLLVLAFVLFLFLLCLGQGKRVDGVTTKEIWVEFVLANLIGLGLLASVILIAQTVESMP